MESFNLNIIPSGVSPVCHASQYDNGRQVRANLFDGLTPYVLQSGDTVDLNLRKPDDTIITASVTATQGNNYVVLVFDEQATAVVGETFGELKIINGSVEVGTLNFVLLVERDVIADGIASESVIKDLDALVAEAVGDNYYNKTEVDSLLDQVDDALALKANSSDVYNKTQVDEALANKADINGSYDDMTVGNAEQLVSSVFTEDKTPYNFRTSGGSADIGNREVDKIVGGTLAFNQLVDNSKFIDKSTSDYTFTKNNDGSYTVVILNTISSNTTVYLTSNSSTAYFKVPKDHVYIISDSNTLPTNIIYKNGMNGGNIGVNTIKTQNRTDGYIFLGVYLPSGLTAQTFTIRPYIIDLTQMFGATIADYIYTLEQGQAGAGVAWFKELFPKPYYAYNAGELMSVKTSSHVMTGFNQFDEITESGYINSSGENTTNANYTRAKNYNKCLPSTSYCFTKPENIWFGVYWYDINKNFIEVSAFSTAASKVYESPANAYYFRVCIQITSYSNNVCVNISWDGERDGEYEPYVKNTYPLDSDLELKGIPKLDANNKLYYDGDTYESSGAVTRRYAIVDLGTVEWTNSSSGDEYTFNNTATEGTRLGKADGLYNLLCASRYSMYYGSVASMPDLTIRGQAGGNTIYVRNTSCTTPAQIKTALSGVYIVYELATPTTEEADAYQNPQIVDDFGTEEYTDSRAVSIPVGHDTQYQVNLRAKLEMAPESPAGNGDYIVRQSNGTNSYVPLVIPQELPDAPTTDGSYKLVVTVSGGVATYTWESN